MTRSKPWTSGIGSNLSANCATAYIFLPCLYLSCSFSLSLKHHTNYEVIFAKIDSFQVVPVSDLSTDDSPSLLNTEPVLKIVFFPSLSLSLSLSLCVSKERTHRWCKDHSTAVLRFNKTGLGQGRKYDVFVCSESKLVILETICTYRDTSHNSECSLVYFSLSVSLIQHIHTFVLSLSLSFSLYLS